MQQTLTCFLINVKPYCQSVSARKISKLISENFLRIQTLFCCSHYGEQKQSAFMSTSVRGALCLCVKLSDSNVMPPRNLSAGREKMLWAMKRWPWVMHRISLNYFCFYLVFGKANGRQNTPIWTQKCLWTYWRRVFFVSLDVLEAQNLNYPYCACS